MKPIVVFLLSLLSYSASAQIYTSRSFQKMEGNRQFTYFGASTGKDSTESASKAEKNAQKALDLAKKSKDGTASFNENGEIGIASIKEMYNVDIFSILDLAKHYSEVRIYEVEHGGMIEHAGERYERHDIDYSRDGSMIQTTESTYSDVVGDRTTSNSKIKCHFQYVGSGASINYPNATQQVQHTEAMDIMTSVVYVWKANDGHESEVDKSDFENAYQKIKEELIKKYGQPIENDKQYDTEKASGYYSTWANGEKLQFYKIKKSRTYHVRYSAKLK